MEGTTLAGRWSAGAAGLLLALSMTGCGSMQSIGSNAAGNAPPAQVPTIALQDPLDPESGLSNMTVWPINPEFYVRQEALRFGFFIKRGQLNKMEIFVSSRDAGSGALGSYQTDPVYPFDASHAAHNERWSFVARDVSVSRSDKTMITLYELFPPVDGVKVLEDLQPIFVSFKEESINPAVRSTPAQFAEARFAVVPVTSGQCRITLFDVVSSPTSVDFKASGCKELAIFANGVEVFRETASSARADFPPSRPAGTTGFADNGGKNKLGILAVDAAGVMTTDGMDYKRASSKSRCAFTSYRDKFDGFKRKASPTC